MGGLRLVLCVCVVPAINHHLRKPMLDGFLYVLCIDWKEPWPHLVLTGSFKNGKLNRMGRAEKISDSFR